MLKKIGIFNRPKENEGQLWADARQLLESGAITPFLSNKPAWDIFRNEANPDGEVNIAASWSSDDAVKSPLTELDNRNLARVTQYYSIAKNDRREAKRYYLDSLKSYLLSLAADDPTADHDLIEDMLQKVAHDDTLTFSRLAFELGYPRYMDIQRHALRLLAELPLPIYITTSPHDFLEVALTQTGNKQPVSEIFYWDDTLYHIPSIWESEPAYQPTAQRPLVYHLYGSDKYPESLVLTEDDYLDCLGRLTMLRYLVNSSNNNSSSQNLLNHKGALPAPVKIAIGGRSLLLLGYNITDWDFRVLFRGLIQANREARIGNSNIPKSISIQLTPQLAADKHEQQKRIQDYLKTFFAQAKFDIYWGDLDQCVYDLWMSYRGGSS